MKIGFWSLVKADKRCLDSGWNSIRTDSYVKWFIGLDTEDFDELFDENKGQIIVEAKVLGLEKLVIILRNTNISDEKILHENDPTLFINLTENEWIEVLSEKVKHFNIPRRCFVYAYGEAMIGRSEIVFSNVEFDSTKMMIGD